MFKDEQYHSIGVSTYRQALLQAILMAYDQSASLKDRFEYARQCLIEMFPHRARPGKTYQGLVKAIRRIPSGIREQFGLCRQKKNRSSIVTYHALSYGQWIALALAYGAWDRRRT